MDKSITNCSGIYIIRNKINRKVYIGSSDRVRSRLLEHLRCLRANRHHSSHLQNAYNKYGEGAFTFRLLEKTINLTKREQYWCNYYKSNTSRYGYNVRTIVNSNRGNKIIISEKTKKKISAALKGRIPSNLAKVQKLVRKPVSLFINGRYIRTYKSQREASRKTGINHTLINNQVRGHSKTIRDFPNHKFVHVKK